MEIWSKSAREDCPESEAGSAGSLGERNAGEKRIGNGVSIEKSRCPCRPAIVSKGVEFRRIAEIDACRSEEHTSELQSLMRISYAVFCLKKKTHIIQNKHIHYRSN